MHLALFIRVLFILSTTSLCFEFLLHDKLLSDAFLLAELDESLVAIFTSIVVLQVLSLVSRLQLDSQLLSSIIKLLKDFGFLLSKVDPDFS